MATKMKTRGRRFAEGGSTDQEAADKAAGLEESNKEKPVGFFERMRMGNIDDPSSEAYKRFGAGRGASSRAAKVPVEDAVPKKVPQIKVEAESMRGGPEEGPAATGMGAATKFASKPAAETKSAAAKSAPMEESPAPAKAPVAPAAKAPSKAPAKAPAAKSEPVFSGRSSGKGGADADELEQYAKKKRMDAAFEPPTDKEIDEGMEAAAAMLPAGASLKAIQAMAKKLAQGKTAKLTKITRADIKPDASNRLGYTKPTSKAPYLKELGNEPLKVGMKKGGKVKAYASGGSVSASRRGDGIATKGKTRGKMC